MQSLVGAGDSLAVDINSDAAIAVQASLSSSFGFADFMTSDGVVRVARAVAVAETAGGADDQQAVVRMRQNGRTAREVTFYRVDDYAGSIGGLSAGPGGLRQQRRHAPTRAGGGDVDRGPGYGHYARRRYRRRCRRPDRHGPR